MIQKASYCILFRTASIFLPLLLVSFRSILYPAGHVKVYKERGSKTSRGHNLGTVYRGKEQSIQKWSVGREMYTNRRNEIN